MLSSALRRTVVKNAARRWQVPVETGVRLARNLRHRVAQLAIGAAATSVALSRADKATIFDEVAKTTILIRPKVQRTKRQTQDVVNRILGFLWQCWPQLLGAVILVAGATVLGLYAPLLVGQIADALAAGASIARPLAAMAAMIGSRFVMTYIASLLTTSACDAFAKATRTAAFSALLEKDVAFFDEHRTGELIDMLSKDVKEMRDSLRAVVSTGVTSFAGIVGGMVSLAITSPQLTGLLGAALIPGVILSNMVASRVRSLARASQDASAEASATAAESVRNIRLVRSFSAEKQELAKYDEALDRQSACSLAVSSQVGFFQSGVMAGMSAMLAGLLFAGSKLVSDGALTVGQLQSFVLSTQALSSSVTSASVLMTRLSRAAGASARVLEVMDEPVLVNTPGGVRWGDEAAGGEGGEGSGVTRRAVEGFVEWKDVHFAYPARSADPVLRGVNLSVQAGETLALVGASGSGKSTLVKLMLNFYSPIAGKVFVDGHALDEVDCRWLRRHVAMVPQDAPLFSSTLAENVRYGRPEATDEEVKAALVTAGCGEFVRKLPRGIETKVGEHGSSLSGGQRQRVALARALLRDPSILVLDEATSALDSRTEHAVQQAIHRAAEGRTTIIIAHRLSTIRDADRIAVVDRGEVVEVGTHAELLARGGHYTRLVQHQTGKAHELREQV